MAGYEPVDVGSSSPRIFRGLPFHVGEPRTAPATIAIGRAARYVIVAHRLRSERPDPGAVVAEYTFHLSDGTRIQVPIRDRFEIGAIPSSWGQLAFVALPDTDNEMIERWAGRWGATGFRQTEASPGYPSEWFLWAWENPAPDASVDRLELASASHVEIGAVTTSDLDEYPFNRQARREVLVELDEGSSEPIDVRVDRGWANYVHPVGRSAEDFLSDPLKGFGEPNNTEWTPAVVEIGALPSATVTVSRGDETLAAVNWGRLQEAGTARGDKAALTLRDRGRNWVHVTVLDDATGKPVPCRVHFRSPEGVAYQPHGHHHQVNSNLGTWHIDVGGDVRLGSVTYAYIDGRCQGWLPRGDVIVDVARGYEYEPLREVVRIEPGRRELTLRLRRWIDMNDRGWYSGDTHVHFLSQRGAHVESQGEDLNVVNLLQSQWGALFTNTEEFTGAPSIARNGTNIVYTTQENRQHVLGHLTLLGLKAAVMPWCTDGPSEAEMGGSLDATMSDWADRCREQGGWVVIPHLPTPNGEPAALIATGRADAVEMIQFADDNHNEYYRYLNCGYRLPLVGGTDKMTSDVPVGMYRAYVKLDDEFTYESWCRGMAAGRSVLSGGPILDLTVDGAGVGDTVRMSGAGTVEVEAWAESVVPIHTLQIVERGRVVAQVDDPKGTRRLELREKIPVRDHTWLAARCGGPSYAPVAHRDGWSRGIFAHTSPVYVAAGDGEWSMFDEGTARYMLTLTEGCLTYIDRTAPFYEPGSVTHHHGEDDHVAWLKRPFLEAREAVEKRLAEEGLL